MRITKDKEDRHQELVDVAGHLFLLKGYECTSVSDIVREAKVAQGTFYYHFKSKDDVLVAVVKKTVAELERRVAAIIENGSARPAKRLRDVLASLLEFAVANTDLIADVHLNANAPIHHRVVGTTTAMLRRYIVPIVREGTQTGCFDVPYPEEAVDFLLGGVAELLHSPGFGNDREHVRRIHETVEIMLVRCLGVEGRPIGSIKPA